MTSITKFFEDNLSGKTAYISSAGLYVQGTVEQKCKMELSEYFGLECFVNLEYNRVDLKELIRVKLLELKEDEKVADFGYDVFGDIHNGLCSLINDTDIKVASIYPKTVEDMKVTYRDGNVHDCELKFKDGSIINIRCIQTPYVVFKHQ